VRFFRVTELITQLLEAKEERQLLRYRQELNKLDIQDEILFLPKTLEGRGEFQEKDMRTIATELDWKMPRACFSTIQLQVAGDR